MKHIEGSKTPSVCEGKRWEPQVNRNLYLHLAKPQRRKKGFNVSQGNPVIGKGVKQTD